MSDGTDANRLPEAMLVAVDLQALLRGDANSNPYIRPGDFVHIPKAEQVFVVGNVYKPSSLPLNEPLTVSGAIARAGGVLPNTKRSRISIVRTGPAGTAETYVDLERIEHHLLALPEVGGGERGFALLADHLTHERRQRAAERRHRAAHTGLRRKNQRCAVERVIDEVRPRRVPRRRQRHGLKDHEPGGIGREARIDRDAAGKAGRLPTAGS